MVPAPAQKLHSRSLLGSALRDQFPMFGENGSPDLIYLDNAATTQVPKSVLEKLYEFYSQYNANLHRSAYKTAERATIEYENAREKVARFINATSASEIVFVRNATEAINFVARGYGDRFVTAGDEIILSEMEHHSNLVPWQMLAKRTGAILRYIELNDHGELNLEQFHQLLSPKTRLVAIVHVSNVLGTRNPVKQIIDAAHQVNAKVLVDGAQSAPHSLVSVREMNADWFVFSGHKMLAPMGIGVLYGKQALLEEMDPTLFGGSMISNVDYFQSTWNEVPWKFEAGTQNAPAAVGLSAAIDFIEKISRPTIEANDDRLTQYALTGLQTISGIRILGPLQNRGPAISFTLGKIHAHDLATFLDQKNIAIRSGHHCAKLIMKRYRVPATARASFYVYNSEEEIDRLIHALEEAKGYFEKWF